MTHLEGSKLIERDLIGVLLLQLRAEQVVHGLGGECI